VCFCGGMSNMGSCGFELLPSCELWMRIMMLLLRDILLFETRQRNKKCQHAPEKCLRRVLRTFVVAVDNRDPAEQLGCVTATGSCLFIRVC
jgi:hypothetical protein